MKKVLLLTAAVLLYSNNVFAQYDLLAENNVQFTNEDYEENNNRPTVKTNNTNTNNTQANTNTNTRTKINKTINTYEEDTTISVPDNIDYNINDTEAYTDFEDFRKE